MKKLSALEGVWDPFQKNLIQFLRLTVRAIFADDSYSQQPIQGALEKVLMKRSNVTSPNENSPSKFSPNIIDPNVKKDLIWEVLNCICGPDTPPQAKGHQEQSEVF